MKKINLTISAVVFFLSVMTSSVFSAENEAIPDFKLEVLGKKSECCGDPGPTGMQARYILGFYKVDLISKAISWGSRVYLVYGFKKIIPGYEGQKDWNWYIHFESEMLAVSPWHWQINFDQILAYQRQPTVLNDLQFYFKIIDREGNLTYLKGSQSLLGYYEAAGLLGTSQNRDPQGMCREGTRGNDEFCSLILDVVEKN